MDERTGPEVRSTDDLILDAAFDAIKVHGITRLSMNDVAKRAGLSRQTLYRHFPSREDLVAAVVVREHAAFEARIRAAAGRHATARPALEALVIGVLEAAREHPLLDRILATEPETLLPYLFGTGGLLLPSTAPMVAELLAERLPHLSAVRIERTADVVARLLFSYAVNPADTAVEELAGGLADVIVNGLKEERA